MKLFAILIFLLFAPIALAQCPYQGPYSGIYPWPNAVSLQATGNPAAPFILILGPPQSIFVEDAAGSVIDHEIVVTGTYYNPIGIGIPPPAVDVRIPLGPLTNGPYVARVRLLDGGTHTPCPELVVPLQVTGGLAAPIPALGVRAAGLLAVLLALVARWSSRRRRWLDGRDDVLRQT